MHIVNIHEAKTHLSRLVDEAARGEAFIIAKAGKPLVKVVPLDADEIGVHRRLGFMKGEIRVPDDFDQMGAETVERLFQEHDSISPEDDESRSEGGIPGRDQGKR
ncbi:type II toxin-antitoxin system Phd/YefM family antitoxin [Methylocaldum szegediense]|uniref:Antitoxin n=1 Tax=Methylocaldum szegediense TaxID=73780 RepID=A0ABM9HYA3_9GAMM|nr:type II toxin-antitoxin system prevent-host-death family antitoxin [Methylocaldum szegediense]CAI8766522.1 Antitoxin (modular protein) [Methylocaldum szegediense]